MVVDGCAFVNLRDGQTRDGGEHFAILFRLEEVLSCIGVVLRELFKFLISQRLVVASFAQGGEQVAARDGAFVDLLLERLGLSHLLGRLLLLRVGDRKSSVLKQKLENLGLVVTAGPVTRRLAAFVLNADIDALLNEILDHFELAVADCVENGSLSVLVNHVGVSLMRHQQLRSLNVALADAVENGGLAISVNVVHVRTLLHKQLDHLAVTFAHGVV